MMISKKMGLSRLLPMLAIGGMFVFSGCDDSKDLYNPDRIQEEAKEAFPVKNIDPNQTWETSAVCNASVSVKETAGETYTIKVYTANPYNTNGDAALLAKTTVTNGQTVNFKFDIPAALQYVYVMKVNGEGYSSAVPAAVENGTVKVVFGEGSGTTRAAMTRGGGSFFTPEVPGEEYFPKQAPEDCKTETSETHNGGGNFLLKDRTYNYLRIEDGGNFYIQGQVTLNGWNEPGKIANFYLLPGATLKLEMKFNHRSNSILSIGEGAKLVANTLKGENGSKFFNRGTIKADNIEVTNAYVYNADTLETKNMLLTNDNSKVCNASGAKMKISEKLEIQGNGDFINETDGVVTAGKTILNCSHGSWENAGHFTTSEMKISAWNSNVKNSCWLTVKEDFTVSEGGIYNESYIECEKLEMQNSIVHMAPNSIFNVKEEAVFLDNWEDNNSQGFIAGGDWALLIMGKASSKNDHNWKDIAYVGKLYIACNNHFSIGDQYNPTYKLEGGAQFTGANNANISIPSSECNPGYNSIPDEDDDNDEELQTYTYAFEDMMKDVGDYDFNDVVLYVTVPYEKNGKTVVDVTLKAAGASKQLAVGFKNNGTPRTIFASVHESLGVPVGTIVNTGDATGTTKTETIEVGDDFSLTNDGDFYISDGKREIHIPNFTSGFNTGDVPYAIRIASSWKWPKERVLITEAYTGFATWAQDATSEPNWYNNSESGKVMN